MMVSGLRLHYVDWGNASAQPMVMVHGLDRVARTFDHVAPHFARRYHVIALDMRGHGDSGWDSEGRYQVEDHAGDLAGLVKALGLRNLVLGEIQQAGAWSRCLRGCSRNWCRTSSPRTSGPNDRARSPTTTAARRPGKRRLGIGRGVAGATAQDE